MIDRPIARAFAVLAAAFFISTTAAPSQAKSDDTGFYRGKTITYIVATPAGSTHDTVGRLIAAEMAHHLPGATIVVKNLPGDRQLLGANAIAAAKPDGLTIGTFSTALIYSQLMNVPNAHFDLRRVSWIGNAGESPRVLVVPSASPIARFHDLSQDGDPFIIAVPPVGSTSYYEARLLTTVMNLNVTVICGYVGGEEEQNMRTGDLVDAAYGRLSSYAAFLAHGDGRILFYVGGDRRLAPPLPYLTRKESPLAQAIVGLIETESDLGQLTVGPPGIPAARLEALRNAYRDAVETPALQAEGLAHGTSLAPYSVGDDVARRIDSALDQSPQTIEAIDRIFGVGKSASN